jgi:hypothetical protein
VRVVGGIFGGIIGQWASLLGSPLLVPGLGTWHKPQGLLGIPPSFCVITITDLFPASVQRHPLDGLKLPGGSIYIVLWAAQHFHVLSLSLSFFFFPLWD